MNCGEHFATTVRPHPHISKEEALAMPEDELVKSTKKFLAESLLHDRKVMSIGELLKGQ